MIVFIVFINIKLYQLMHITFCSFIFNHYFNYSIDTQAIKNTFDQRREVSKNFP